MELAKKYDMETTRLYQSLCEACPSGSPFPGLVSSLFGEACDVARLIVRHLREFTLHDPIHLKQVVRKMDSLLPDQVLEGLGPLELGTLILSAGYHDVGLVISQSDADQLREVSTQLPGELSDEQLVYWRFRLRHSELLSRQDNLRDDGRHEEAQQMESYLLVQFLRTEHGNRARRFILEQLAGRLEYGNLGFADRLADVCASHTRDVSALLELPASELVGNGEYCSWRFVGVMLRLADLLDFDPKRTPATLFKHLGVRDPVSISEWRKHQAMTGWDIRPGTIAFAAQCADPVIEKTIRQFIEAIDRELRDCAYLLTTLADSRRENLLPVYDLNLPRAVNTTDVRPEVLADGNRAYEYVDLRFALDHERVMELLLGIELYGDRRLFIRELLQNAVDACRLREAIHGKSLESERYEPLVVIGIVETADGMRRLFVEDNGIGMNRDVIARCFANVGQSYFNSGQVRQEYGLAEGEYQPVSQFGIGVLSVFMAGDHLQVSTKHLTPEAPALDIEISDRGALFWFKPGERLNPGTSVSIKLTGPPWLPSQDEGVLNRLASIVEELAPHTGVQLAVVYGGEVRDVKEDWSAPKVSGAHQRFVNAIAEIPISLTDDAPEGIRGEIVFHCPVTRGRHLTTSVAFEGTRLLLRRGRIDERLRETHAYGTPSRPVIRSFGTFSQSGFSVPVPLFRFKRDPHRKDPGCIAFPLPATYNVDLSGVYALHLTVDRTRIAWDDESVQRARQVQSILHHLLMDALQAMHFDFDDNVKHVLDARLTQQE